MNDFFVCILLVEGEQEGRLESHKSLEIVARPCSPYRYRGSI